MRAMVLEKPGASLAARDLEMPRPTASQARIAVDWCGVCRTDLHVVDGELSEPKLPLIPGHQIVGRVQETGAEAAASLSPGQVVGVPWLGWSCGTCPHCRAGEENLCPEARFTGYQLDGGYAEQCAADARFCFPLPATLQGPRAAPLLCAGLIGYRAYRTCGANAIQLGFYGFGASAHLLTQLAVRDGCTVHAFTRPGDTEGQAFARRVGAAWAGGSDQAPPRPLDAAIIFAPVGGLVPTALRAVRPGGTVVCAGIHMSAIPSFPYDLLWGERTLRSVANLTRADGRAFLPKAEAAALQAEAQVYPLEDANRALDDLRAGRLTGAAVLRVGAEST
jgi:propanol-preferring alcohol dehydrogenase